MPQTPEYADFAAQLAQAQAAERAMMSKIRVAAKFLMKQHRYSLAVIAKKVGLHKNSVMRLTDKTWMPKTATLHKLGKLVLEAEGVREGRIKPDPGIKRGRPPTKNGSAVAAAPAPVPAAAPAGKQNGKAVASPPTPVPAAKRPRTPRKVIFPPPRPPVRRRKQPGSLI